MIDSLISVLFIKNIIAEFNLVMTFILYAYIFYLTGKLILRHLLRCRAFAVKDHSVMSSRGAKRRGDLMMLRLTMRLPHSHTVVRNDNATSACEYPRITFTSSEG
jgi:hypothetical protein